MAYHLMPWDREQGYLMPPSLLEWLPEGDLAWFILDVVEQMDLKEFYGVYREDGWGAAAYDPGMMVGILLFAYCQGVRSSRRIAWALERDIGFRVVAANQQPDFRTICRFRAEREEALERLFVQVLRDYPAPFGYRLLPGLGSFSDGNFPCHANSHWTLFGQPARIHSYTSNEPVP